MPARTGKRSTTIVTVLSPDATIRLTMPIAFPSASSPPMSTGARNGTSVSLPPPSAREAWERGLDAIEAEAQARHSKPFAELEGIGADALLHRIEQGEVEWRDLDAKTFWQWRLIPDLVSAYWAHPSAWSAMGFGGPASPRGYVRMDANRRDPWEAAEGDRVANRHVR